MSQCDVCMRDTDDGLTCARCLDGWAPKMRMRKVDVRVDEIVRSGCTPQRHEFVVRVEGVPVATSWADAGELADRSRADAHRKAARFRRALAGFRKPVRASTQTKPSSGGPS